MSFCSGAQGQRPRQISNLVPPRLATISTVSTNRCTPRPFLRQDSQFMKMAVSAAEFNVRVGHWNKGTMTAYLRTCAMSRRVIENVWRVGKNLNQVNGPANVFECEDGELDNGWIAASSDTYPKIWDSKVPFDAHLDCGMHLLFHGVVQCRCYRHQYHSRRRFLPANMFCKIDLFGSSPNI